MSERKLLVAILELLNQIQEDQFSTPDMGHQRKINELLKAARS